jgi:hypothetical protein
MLKLLETANVPSSPFLSPWRWRWYVPPKHRFLQEPHGVTSKKMASFIIAAVKTSNIPYFNKYECKMTVDSCLILVNNTLQALSYHVTALQVSTACCWYSHILATPLRQALQVIVWRECLSSWGTGRHSPNLSRNPTSCKEPHISHNCLAVRLSDYRSRGPGFDSRCCLIFWEAVCLEWAPLSLLRITDELLEWRVAAPVQRTQMNGSADPLRWPRDIIDFDKWRLLGQ